MKGVNVVLFAWRRDPTAQKFKGLAQCHSNSVVALGTVEVFHLLHTPSMEHPLPPFYLSTSLGFISLIWTDTAFLAAFVIQSLLQDHGFLTGHLGKLSQETLDNNYLSIHESQISNSISEYGMIKLRNLIHNVSYFQASNFLSLCSFESQTDEDSGTLCLFQKRTMEPLFCQAAGHTQSVLRKNRSQKTRTLQNTSEDLSFSAR